MFNPDETQAQLMAAEDKLHKAHDKMLEARWAGNALKLLLTAADMGTTDFSNFIELLRLNKARIEAMGGVFDEIAEALLQGAGAVATARGKIPNTTPPDPRGFESCRG